MTSRFWFSSVIAVSMLMLGCQAPLKKTSTSDTDDTSKPSPIGEVSKDNTKLVGDQQLGKLYIPTGDPETSAVMLESSIPAEIQANKPFNFEIKVTNISKVKLEGVEVSQTVPGNLKIKDVTEGNSDGKPNTLTYSAGVLNSGEAKIYRLQGTAGGAGPLGMCVSARYNTSLCIASNVVSPALKLTSTGPAELLKCEPIAYKIKVTNSGSGQAKNVKIESALPEGLTTADGKKSAAFEIPTLAAGESKDFTISAKALKAGTYEVKATAKADDNLLSDPATVKTAIKEPILVLTKTGPEKAFYGQQMGYEITVTNKGDGVAKNVVIYDNVPVGVVVQGTTENGKADSTGKIRWNIGDLPPGATKKVSDVITYDKATSDKGDLRTAASVTADCVENVSPVMIATALSGVPAILLEVVDDPDPVKVGDKTTYTIEVTNQGTAAGTNIKLVVATEDEMTFISAAGATKEKVEGKTISFAPIPSLAPKAKATFTVTVQANKPGDVRFKTTMTSEQLGRPVEETEATTFYAQ